ncbi:MAG: hypothetical protein HY673_09035, partial [Chloroflexi bacterium]|nr:hypothetical protein [Chloroflexota bacterium]
TLNKSAGTGAATFYVPFNNTGTVNVSSGALRLDAGSTHAGTLNIPLGQTLQLANGTHDLGSGATVTGAGVVAVISGTSNFNGAITVPNLNLSGGALGGSGGLNVTGAWNWTAGDITGPGVKTNSGALNLTGGSSRNLRDGTLNNTGTVNWATGAPWTLEYTATLNNQAGGVLNVQGDNSLSLYGGGSKILNNAGTLNKSAGTGAATFYVPFNNTGTVNVNSGTLKFDAGSTHAGTLNIPSGQTLQLANGTHDLGSGATVTGAGVLAVISGTSNFNAAITVPNLNLSGGTLGGSGGLNVTGAWNWTGGNITGAGAKTNSGALNVTGGSSRNLSSSTLNNSGTVNWAGGTPWTFEYTSTANNLFGATFNIQGDNTLSTYASGTRNFNNAGTLNKSGGTGTATFYVPFNNTGTVNVNSGKLNLAAGLSNFSSSTSTLTGGSHVVQGTLQFPGANIVTNAAGITLDGAASAIVNESGVNALLNLAANGAAGSLTIQNGRNFSSTAAFSNAGNVTVGSGSLFTANPTYTQTAGTTTVNGAFAASGGVNINGGTLSGSGTITGNVSNAGVASPGSSPGILNITGNYTQTASGILNVEIGGLTPGDQFDQINITGSASLDGTLNVTAINNFTPAGGNSFQIMSFASRTGDFAAKNGLNLAGGIRLVPNLTGAALTLSTVQVLKGAELELTQDVDASGFVIFKVAIKRVKDLSNGTTTTAAGGLGSYDASLTYAAAGLTILDARGVAPFSTISSVRNTEGGAKTTFNSSQTASTPQAPVTVAHLYPSLIGSRDNTYTVTLAFSGVSSVSAEVISPDPAVNLGNLRRGNARDIDDVDMSDALFIAQYRVGIRGLGTGDLAVNPLNAASVMHDVGGEKIDMNDALFIAQMRVGLRDASYNWMAG